MKKKLIPVLAAFLGFGVVSCNNSSGDLLPAIDTNKKMTVKGKATYGSTPTGGRIAAAVAIDKFLVNVEKLELKIDEADERSATDSVHSEPEFDGPFVLDLLADTLAVDLAGAEIPAGIYDEIEFDLAPSNDASSGLDGKSVLIEGDISGVPFKFWTDKREDFEINFTKNGGDLVVENTGFVIVIDFNLDALFGVNGTVDLSKAKDGNGDGVIEIYPNDPDGNNTLSVKILSELEDAAELEEDEDLDEDGEGNSEDDDIDGDGVENDEDEDDDNDGINDDEDNDDDGDGEDDDDEDNDDGETDDDDADEQKESAINTLLMSGDWTLTSYVDKTGSDLTDEFTGFYFSFDAGEALRADNLDTQVVVEGEWEAITNSDMPILLIEFEVEEGPFEQLEDDWDIVSTSDTKVELTSSSDSGNKTLVLEQL
ncbi:hypothetical protein [Ekhidna sp.]|uniref:hypothetical protein n=1 Tax=Ekhidna sp. TaxID=2608089 RepID=UPI0032EF99E0